MRSTSPFGTWPVRWPDFRSTICWEVRTKVRTHASTYNNLGSPEECAAYALECKNRGYTAYKIHSNYYWDPATRQADASSPVPR